MSTLRYFTVVPKLPGELNHLWEIANNLWWSWQPDAIDLFRRLDAELWSSTEHNPIKILGQLSQSRLQEIARDDGFLNHLQTVYNDFQSYLAAETWYSRLREQPGLDNLSIAYFSAEYGIHECLPIYSGGLGILSGDHLKSASDLGIPLVGVGLMYRQGYFRQTLNADAWQHERYPENDFHNMPLDLVRDESGNPVRSSLQILGHQVEFGIWRVRVGRVNLYLLDTNLEINRPEDRDITRQLYGGDHEMRLRQEILLGIGGYRALRAIGIEPSVCHMNEGHSAFMPLERIRTLMQNRQLDFDSAAEAITAANVFTTHTPVPAGNDRFEPGLLQTYLHSYIVGELGLDMERFIDFGRETPGNLQETFCMTVMALRFASYRNGVSKLHGQVSRNMWQRTWPGRPVDEIPIGHITNGVHLCSWLAKDMRVLLERYLGTGWAGEPETTDIWQRINHIPDPELWHVREILRRRLVNYTRRSLRDSLQRRGASPGELRTADEVLDPRALTIGFARRFATYKRGSLLFHDIDRLKAILCDQDRPVQFIFAGKAHPRDEGGKRIIKHIIDQLRDPELRHRIVFLEDYDINLARRMVQGVDLWLNNPRRPLEACGTSGMKVTPNAGLNLSILDGWWDEGYEPGLGWAIGAREIYDDPQYQDEVEASAIYSLLEREIVPAFYERTADGIPREWLRTVKQAMSSLLPTFNTAKMVENYSSKYYLTAHLNHNRLSENNHTRARELAQWTRRVQSAWSDVRVEDLQITTGTTYGVGESARVEARIFLGPLQPEDVIVEAYYGRADHSEALSNPTVDWLPEVEELGDGRWVFSGQIPCHRSGRFGCSVRVSNNAPLSTRRPDISPLVWW